MESCGIVLFTILVNVGVALQCLCNLGVAAAMSAVRAGSEAGAFHQCDVVEALCELHAVMCNVSCIICGEMLMWVGLLNVYNSLCCIRSTVCDTYCFDGVCVILDVLGYGFTDCRLIS